ncbi:hypothetical protein C8Q76DRAFT_713541 [Earliella scabrosa]|nr:hypothetical protein C8Q76DRAFT_713541 [Earliella scabrosa]
MSAQKLHGLIIKQHRVSSEVAQRKRMPAKHAGDTKVGQRCNPSIIHSLAIDRHEVRFREIVEHGFNRVEIVFSSRLHVFVKYLDRDLADSVGSIGVLGVCDALHEPASRQSSLDLRLAVQHGFGFASRGR